MNIRSTPPPNTILLPDYPEDRNALVAHKGGVTDRLIADFHSSPLLLLLAASIAAIKANTAPCENTSFDAENGSKGFKCRKHRVPIVGI